MKKVISILTIFFILSTLLQPFVGYAFDGDEAASTLTSSEDEQAESADETQRIEESSEEVVPFDENENVTTLDEVYYPWENDDRLRITLDSGNAAYVTHNAARVALVSNGLGGIETHFEIRKLVSLDDWRPVASFVLTGSSTSSSRAIRWVTGLEPGTTYQVRWYFYHINPNLRRVGHMTTFTTAGRPAMQAPVVTDTTINSATFTQSVAINANDSKYLPTKLDLYLTNKSTGVVQTLSYPMSQVTLGYSNQNEINSLRFTINSLAENTEYSLQTVLWTGTGREVGSDDVTLPQTIDSNRSNSVTFRTGLDELAITTESIELPLGSHSATIDAKRMIKEVKLQGNVINSNQYSAELINSIETLNPGSRRAEIKVDYGVYSSVVSVPVTIVWGSSIRVLGSWSASTDMRTIGAYTWHPNEGITYVPGQIASSLTTNSLPQAGNNTAAKLSLFSGNQDITIGTTASNFEFEIKGNETPNTALDNFKAKTNQQGMRTASVGDVVESWHIYQNNEASDNNILTNRQWNVLMENEEIVDHAGGKNSIYYEITSTGFRPLVVNQSTGIAGTITRHTTNNELEQQIADYLNLPSGVAPVSFVDYPDRSQLGETTGIIRVSETLNSGKRLFYDITVDFTVTTRDNSLAVEANPQQVQLGTTMEMIDVRTLISRVTFDGIGLNPDEYSLELRGEIDTSIPGSNRQLPVRITYGTYTTEMTVPIEVIWGNSLRISGSWSNSNDFRTVAAYTWHPNYGITYVPGQGASSLTSFALTQVGATIFSRLNIFSGAGDITIGKSTRKDSFELAGGETPSTFVEKFRTQTNGSNRFEASIGDVVESWHLYKSGQDTGNSITSGREWNIQMVDESMTDQTGGLNSVYYELTESGYRPLVVNQTTGIEAEITRHTTDTELDACVSDYLDLPNGVAIVGFEEYPDRSSLGETQGKIKVEEQLLSGKKIQYEVEVDFSVVASDEDWIEVTIPLEMMFYGTSNIESGIQSIASPEYSFTNHSTVPVKLSIDSIQNETNINRLLLLHLHGEPIIYDIDIIVAGRVINNTAFDILMLGVDETERIGFTGDAFFFREEINPYFEIVFKVTS
ncbi:hypothetical protein [Candidatus Enterococcus murrayae]|uniref:Uncharacterized protein n=1 Tax=Candidatus Enterococcus murrayae TaxID=2815321 RepID=A0ABS3HHQ4_9ENTE|nr:hypothetical protein [Enterococcus sp. MJM16]MBO0452975.1 hypothetical protein [Enterococcus sp. MJM16]